MCSPRSSLMRTNHPLLHNHMHAHTHSRPALYSMQTHTHSAVSDWISVPVSLYQTDLTSLGQMLGSRQVTYWCTWGHECVCVSIVLKIVAYWGGQGSGSLIRSIGTNRKLRYSANCQCTLICSLSICCSSTCSRLCSCTSFSRAAMK